MLWVTKPLVVSLCSYVLFITELAQVVWVWVWLCGVRRLFLLPFHSIIHEMNNVVRILLRVPQRKGTTRML